MGAAAPGGSGRRLREAVPVRSELTDLSLAAKAGATVPLREEEVRRLPAADVPPTTASTATWASLPAVSPAREFRGGDAIKFFESIDSSLAAGTLTWERLAYSVATKGGRREILKGVSGDLRPAELTCILGPSGSGKTSLLNVLAGRVRRGGKSRAEIAGEVRVNGYRVETSEHQRLFGYVMQEDALLGTMTPREVFQFAARLRLNIKAVEAVEVLIEDLLANMGLGDCADTLIGNDLIKGISGGERKRVAVGAELISNPQITFLDEPTSGLDTAAAYDVISVLKQLSEMNRSVLCTIHQPSSEVVHMFDQAIFLVAGEVAYHGPPGMIRSHFAKLGLQCPEDYNPADFVMFCIQAKGGERVGAIVRGWAEHSAAKPPLQGNGDAVLPTVPSRKGFWVQLAALGQREVKNVVRDRATLAARFGTTLFLSLTFALAFFRVGDRTASEGYDLQSHSGALTMLGITALFGAAEPMLLAFTSERPVFLREHAGNMYGPLPYFLSKAVVELPVLVAQMSLMWCVTYWSMGLRGNFFVHLLGSWLIAVSGASAGLVAACLVRDAKQAMEVAPGILVPQVLFAGFFVKTASLPAFMRGLQYVCCLKWGMNILMLNEFPGEVGLLKANDVDEDDFSLYCVVMGVIFLGFRLVAAVLLTRRARAFYD